MISFIVGLILGGALGAITLAVFVGADDPGEDEFYDP